jgi:hypothetical protein
MSNRPPGVLSQVPDRNGHGSSVERLRALDPSPKSLIPSGHSGHSPASSGSRGRPIPTKRQHAKNYGMRLLTGTRLLEARGATDAAAEDYYVTAKVELAVGQAACAYIAARGAMRCGFQGLPDVDTPSLAELHRASIVDTLADQEQLELLAESFYETHLPVVIGVPKGVFNRETRLYEVGPFVGPTDRIVGSRLKIQLGRMGMLGTDEALPDITD